MASYFGNTLSDLQTALTARDQIAAQLAAASQANIGRMSGQFSQAYLDAAARKYAAEAQAYAQVEAARQAGQAQQQQNAQAMQNAALDRASREKIAQMTAGARSGAARDMFDLETGRAEGGEGGTNPALSAEQNAMLEGVRKEAQAKQDATAAAINSGFWRKEPPAAVPKDLLDSAVADTYFKNAGMRPETDPNFSPELARAAIEETPVGAPWYKRGLSYLSGAHTEPYFRSPEDVAAERAKLNQFAAAQDAAAAARFDNYLASQQPPRGQLPVTQIPGKLGVIPQYGAASYFRTNAPAPVTMPPVPTTGTNAPAGYFNRGTPPMTTTNAPRALPPAEDILPLPATAGELQVGRLYRNRAGSIARFNGTDLVPLR